MRAVVLPLAAYVIARDYGAELDKRAQALIAVGQENVGHQLLDAVAQLRESGRHAREAIAAGGKAALPTPRRVSASEVPPWWEHRQSVYQVATRISRPERTVRYMCKREVLVATNPSGREWFIDPESVEDWQARRPEAT